MPKSIPNKFDAQPNVPISGARIRCAISNGVQLEFPGSDILKWLSIATLVEITQSVGIKKGGNLPCSLIYIVSKGGYSQLVRVGSPEHQKAVDKDELRWLEPIKSSELKVGGLYRSLSGWGIFLGHMHSKPIEIHWPLIKDKYPLWNRMLWCVLVGPERPPIEALIQAATLEEQFKVLDAGSTILKGVLGPNSLSDATGYRFEMKSSHQYRKLLNSIELTAEQVVGILTAWVITRLECETDFTYWFRLTSILAIAAIDRPRIPEQLQRALKKLKYTYIGEDTPLDNFPELLTDSNAEVRSYARGMFVQLKAR